MADDLTIPKLPVRDLPKPQKRKPLTRAQVIMLCIRQTRDDGLLCCGCGCGNPLDPECIDEHVTPRETLPADKADELDNRALYNFECAKAKTVGDQAVIAKSRRVRGERGSQRAKREKNGPQIPSRPFMSLDPRGAACFGGLKSRGFDKTKTRKFSGQVVSRGSIRSKAEQA